MVSREEGIGIVCHDAGGAEIISSYILQESLVVRFCLEGPAIKIFERKLGTIKRESLLEVINNSSSLLCGTSWESDLEWDSIKEANNQGKKVVSFLDHWVNYQERFVRNDIILLPDEIWVGDVYAKVIAKNCFPNLKIKLVENPYFSEITKILNKLWMQHIHTGEGGVLVTNDDELADRMRLIRNHAEAVVEDKGITNLSNMIGHNFRSVTIKTLIEGSIIQGTAQA